MRVYGYKQGKLGEFEIDNTLEALQGFVDGYVESIKLSNDLVLLCDEDARYKAKAVSSLVTIQGIPVGIRGDFLICRRQGSELASITDADLKAIRVRG